MADNIPDPQQQALFREVDEELRHEQMHKLWKQYGPVAIAVSVLVVAVVAGYQGWKAWQSHQHMADARSYEQALTLADTGKDADALTALTALASKGNDGAVALAQIQRAVLLQKDGKTSDALAIYKGIATGKGDTILRSVAALRYALLGMDNGVSSDEINSLITPLAAPGLPFDHSARQVQALLALKEGRGDDARKLLQDLVDDASTPQGIRSRANILLQSLDSKPAAK